MKSVNQIHPISTPIPIPYNNNKKNYRCSSISAKKHCNCSPIDSPKKQSFSDSNMRNQTSSSAPVLINFEKESDIISFHDEFTYSLDENDLYPQSCPTTSHIMNVSSVHLVNGLNIDTNVMETEHFYVLCDVPKIKNVSNTLSYHILDSKKGIMAFVNEQHIHVLKKYLELPYHVVKINRQDLIRYNKTTKSSSIILYNSYTDIESKSSYFLYYDLNAD